MIPTMRRLSMIPDEIPFLWHWVLSCDWPRSYSSWRPDFFPRSLNTLLQKAPLVLQLDNNKVSGVFYLLLWKSTTEPTEVCWQVFFFPSSHSHHIIFPSNWCLSPTLLAGAALQSIRNLTTVPLARRGWIWPKFNKGSGDALKAAVSHEQTESQTTLRRQKMWWISLNSQMFSLS